MELIEKPCLVCAGTATKPLYRKFDLNIVRCRTCGFVFTNPRMKKDEIWKRYGSEYFEKEYLPSYGIRGCPVDLSVNDGRYRAMLDAIERNAGGRGELLEIGAGAGLFLKAAERAGWKVQGTDIMDAGIEFAKTALGLELRREAAEELDLPAASVDVVAMFEVIEHLWDPVEVIQRIRRGLRRGGLLAISTPNFNALSRFAHGNGWAVLSPAEHLFYFTQTSLKRFLERHGFSDVEFMRRHDGCGAEATMNAVHTHTPEKLRTKLYAKAVAAIGKGVFRFVQRQGLGDTLFCFCRRVDMTPGIGKPAPEL